MIHCSPSFLCNNWGTQGERPRSAWSGSMTDSRLFQMASSILITDPPPSVGHLFARRVMGTGWEIGPALLHFLCYSERQSSPWLWCMCALISGRDWSSSSRARQSIWRQTETEKVWPEWKFEGKERQMAEEMKVRPRWIVEKEGDQSVKERWMREGGLNGRRKKGRKTESFIWLSQPWWYDRLGNPKRFTMPPPTRDNLPCRLTHTPSCRAHTHTHQLYLIPIPPPYLPSPPSLPPSVSVQDNPSPNPQIPSLSKKILPRARIAGSHMLRARTKGKGSAHMQMRRDTYTQTPKTHMTASAFHR